MIMDAAELNKIVENTFQLLKETIYLQPHSQADREYYRDMIDQVKSNLLEIIEAKIQEAIDAHLEAYQHVEKPLTEADLEALKREKEEL